MISAVADKQGNQNARPAPAISNPQQHNMKEFPNHEDYGFPQVNNNPSQGALPQQQLNIFSHHKDGNIIPGPDYTSSQHFQNPKPQQTLRIRYK